MRQSTDTDSHRWALDFTDTPTDYYIDDLSPYEARDLAKRRRAKNPLAGRGMSLLPIFCCSLATACSHSLELPSFSLPRNPGLRFMVASIALGAASLPCSPPGDDSATLYEIQCGTEIACWSDHWMVPSSAHGSSAWNATVKF